MICVINEKFEIEAKAYLDDLADDLLATNNRIKIKLTRNWANGFSVLPGIYAIFRKSKLIYVVETGSIRGRMKDLLDSRNHTVRRSIGKRKFSEDRDYRDASSSKKFPLHIENKVTKWIESQAKISTVIVKFGRKELEEMLVAKFLPVYNKKGQRVTN